MKLSTYFCQRGFLLVSIVSLVAGGMRPARADESVNEAIDRGIDYLLGAMDQLQRACPEKDKGEGLIALETYALIVAGVSTQHPTIRRNFGVLDDFFRRSNYVYGLCCYIFALDAAIAQEEADLVLLNPKLRSRKFKDNPAIGREYRPNLEHAVTKLARMHGGRGRWRYHGGGENYDNSVTQFAVLALGVATKRGIPIGEEVWQKVADHFIEQQEAKGEQVDLRITLMSDDEVVDRRLRGKKPREKVEVEVVSKGRKKATEAKEKKREEKKQGRTGAVPRTRIPQQLVAMPQVGTESIPIFQRGWRYRIEEEDKKVTWNMTCAGLSSLLLARKALEGRMGATKVIAMNKAIRDGFAWMLAHWGASNGGYYGMYSLEKVADIGEVKLFGSHDWYEEVSKHIVSQQRPDGSWPGGAWEHRKDSAFALLILNRATSITLLTLESQDPLARIMVSGKRSNVGDPGDRSWVYVPDLDSTVHYPTLLRLIRLRGHPRLVRLLSNIVDNYAPEWKGELIPDMAQIRDLIADKKAHKVIDGYLADITGHSYDDPEQYLKWHRRWQRVMAIGMERKVERIPDLVKYYKSTSKSFPLKKSVVWAMSQCKAKQAIPLFLEDLDHPDGRVRLEAYNAFKRFFIKYPPPFDPLATDSVRRKQVAAIREWYEDQKGA